jgi:hypothetical protein
MPEARDWPTKAEHARQDCVALFLDVQYLSKQTQYAIIEGDLEEAMRLTTKAYDVGAKGQQALNEARRGQ